MLLENFTYETLGNHLTFDEHQVLKINHNCFSGCSLEERGKHFGYLLGSLVYNQY
jgi:hypothetical protein